MVVMLTPIGALVGIFITLTSSYQADYLLYNIISGIKGSLP